MRRSVGLLSVAAAFAVPGVVSAAPLPAPDPGAVAEEDALASWMFPTDRPGYSKWFFAGAYREAVAGGRTVTTAFAVKGRCRVVRQPGQRVTRCHGRGVGGNVSDDAFRVDPALREATLVLSDDGATHRLTWTSDTAPPSGYIAGEACDEGTGQGAGFMRHATARGDLFERRLGPAGIDHALLSRGAMATECTSPSVRRIARRAGAGDTVTVVFR